VAWNTLVIFDANHIDQPWRVPARLDAMERPGHLPGQSTVVVSTVVNTDGPTDVLETTEGAPESGPELGKH
jgi:hypothetical protein